METVTTIWNVAGRDVRVSQLDKLYWPAEHLTKGDLLSYYREIAPVMLPHLAGRPVTVRLFPDGITRPGYYRRARPDDAPDWLGSVVYQPERDGDTLAAILVQDAASLIWLANSGSIEFHGWSARVPHLDEPDQAIFDLDPGDAVGFADVLRAALLVREALERLGLRAYPKTSGGRGMHVYVPLSPGHTYETVRGWVKAFAARLAAESLTTIGVARGGTHRGRNVTVDYAQNSKGKNTAAAYTVRALPGAPVSAPLTWDEVGLAQLKPSDLTMRAVLERVSKEGDHFERTLSDRQRLPAS